MSGPDLSDRCVQLVYETEGQHGADLRGWHGEAQRMEAEAQDYEREMYERNARDEYEQQAEQPSDEVQS
jgi:hypothetical protein